MKYQPHPAAEIFPLMTDEEFSGLVEDIKEHGLIEPIILYEDMVLDGRNRLRACEQLDIEPRFESWSNGDDPHFYVISKNLHRRHMTEGQKGIVMAEFATRQRENNLMRGNKVPEGSQDPSGLTNDEAAAIAGVSAPTIKRAKTVLKHGTPEDIEAVKSGAALAPIARCLTKTKSSIPPKPRIEGVNAREIVSAPDGLTLETWCRQGLSLEADGLGTRDAADKAGIPHASYRKMRDIVLLADREDLHPTDMALVRDSLADMNKFSRVTSPHTVIEHLVDRMWGEKGLRTNKTIDRRSEDFERAFGHVVQVGMDADKIEIPYISEERAKRALRDLNKAMRNMRALKAKLEELYQ